MKVHWASEVKRGERSKYPIDVSVVSPSASAHEREPSPLSRVLSLERTMLVESEDLFCNGQLESTWGAAYDEEIVYILDDVEIRHTFSRNNNKLTSIWTPDALNQPLRCAGKISDPRPSAALFSGTDQAASRLLPTLSNLRLQPTLVLNSTESGCLSVESGALGDRPALPGVCRCYTLCVWVVLTENEEDKRDKWRSACIQSLSPDYSLVTLIHTGHGQGDAWQKAYESHLALWMAGLRNLASVVNEGKDLRRQAAPRA
jgi:hypothetical protein